jgi:WD40 repeat protein
VVARAGLGGPRNWPLTAEFSPSGRLVVTADTDGTARLWNVATR